MAMSMYFCVVLISVLSHSVNSKRYEPNWKSLDARPLPAWYDEGKVGIFIHWGVFSVPAFGSEWFWWYWHQKVPGYVQYMKDNYRPDFTYADFAHNFRAEFFNPNQWADLIKSSGARYVMFVTKHHEGFTNWPSNHSFSWNSMDVGPKRDIVGELAAAIRSRTDVRFGVYHSLFEWFNPLYLGDKANKFHTNTFVKEKAMPELYDLIMRYKPEGIWSDGDWEASDTYWESKEFLAWLYNDSPVKDTIVVNDRWGNTTHCKHGGYWNCNDREHPGKLLPHKWENAMTLDKVSWGFRANANLSDYLTIEELLGQLVTTVSLGGNILINVGPTSRGIINPIFTERLTQLGSWLKVNGEAIYKTHVWSHQNDSLTKDAWYTSKGNTSSRVVYALLLSWPEDGQLNLSFPKTTSSTSISLVGLSGQLKFRTRPEGGITVLMPTVPVSKLPCKWAWSLKIEGLKNQKTILHPNSFAQKVESIRKERDLY